MRSGVRPPGVARHLIESGWRKWIW